jgi:hypothetical protein
MRLEGAARVRPTGISLVLTVLLGAKLFGLF